MPKGCQAWQGTTTTPALGMRRQEDCRVQTNLGCVLKNLLKSRIKEGKKEETKDGGMKEGKKERREKKREKRRSREV